MKKILSILLFSISIYIQAQTPNYVPSTGLVGWWSFTGNAIDSSVNGNHGTVNGATLTADRFGLSNKAYSFNGSTSHISIPNHSSLNFQTQNKFSFSYWINAVSLSSSQVSIILSKQAGSGSTQNGYNSNIEIGYQSNFRLQNGSPNPAYSLSTSTNSITTNSWYHIVQVWTGTQGQIYINGVLVAQSSGTGVIGNNSLNLLIGQANWSLFNVKNFNGKIDDIGIWNRSLTTCEIQALYSGSLNTIFNSSLITQDTIKACGDSVLVSATSGMNTYNWSNGKTTASFFAKSTGWYKITATNIAGCSGMDSVFVSIVKANILNNDTAICLGRSVRLRADTISLNYTTGITCLEIQENNSGILQGPLGSIISNINFASYGTPTGSCNSYNISSCSAANSFSIVSNLCIGNNLCNLSATNSVFGDPCGGIYKRLYVSATYQIKSDKYLWSTGDTTPTINVTPTVTTKYWVRVSNGSHFCTDTVTVTVNQPPINLISQDTIKACGDSVLVSATSGMNTYSWSNGKTTASFFAKSTGWYKVTATNNLGCPGTDSVFVSIINTLIDINDTSICINSTIKLTALSNNLFLSNLFNGTSNYFEMPLSGPIGSSQRTFSYWVKTSSQSTMSVLAYGINSNWSGGDYLDLCLNLNMGYGAGSSSCAQHNKGASYFSNAHGATFAKTISDSIWHHVVYVMGENNNFSFTNIKIYVDGVLVSMGANGIPYCGHNWGGWIYNTSSSIMRVGRSFISNNPYTTYFKGDLRNLSVWSRALNQSEIINLKNNTISIQDTNLMYFYKFDKLVSDSILIDYKSNNHGILKGGLSNYGTSVIYESINNYSYLWSTGDTTPTINVTPNITTKYWVRVSNGSHFCTDTVTVTVNQPPINLISQDTIKACGDSVLVSATSGLNSYSWSNGKTTASFFAKSAGWYKVTATNSAGCPGTDSVFVSIVKANILNNDTAICLGNSIKISVDSFSGSSSCTSLSSNLQNGLVGYWPFCGNANDASGNGNNGTVNGATLTTDRFGNTNNAYSFNGVSNKIEIPATSAFDVLQFTISYWINTNSSANQHLVSKSNWSNAASEMFCTYLTPSQICFEVKKNSSCVGGNGWNKVSSNLPSNFLSNWHLLTYSYDGTNMKFYLNGTLLNSATLIGPIDLCSGGQLKIGAWWSSHTLYYSGKTDDMSFWNRALNSQEIQQLYTPAYPQTYLWSTGDTTPTINVTPSVTTKYWVRVSNGSHFCTDTFTVTVNTNTLSTINQTICQGQSLLGRTVSGVYIDTLIGANNKGCDSIRTLILTVNDTTKKDSFRTICKNQSVLFNGNTLNISGTYGDTLVNAKGCDSFLYLHLTVNDTTKKDSFRTICKNYPVLFNGLWINNSGTYKDTLVNANGCDSFLYLHLTVNDTTKKDSFRTICKNYPVLFNGVWINNSGTYKDTLVNANGCDSFIYLHLKVDTIPISNAGINKPRVNCAGDSVQIGTIPNANYAYSWSPNLFLSDNNTSQPWVKAQTTTSYILIVTDNNTNCQSMDTVEVNVIANNLDATKQVKNIRCFGENNGEVTIKGINGYTDYSYKIGTGNFIDSGTYKNLAPGIIPYTVKDSKGCLYNDTFLITEPLLLKIDTTLKKNICYRGEDGEIQVLVSGGNNPYNYNWSSSKLNLPKIGNLRAGTYHLTITDKNGCIINQSFDLIQPDAIKLGDTLIQKNICHGDSMASIDVSIIGGVGQYEYIWSNGDKSKKVTNLKQGFYSLTATDSAKCTQKYQFSIIDYPKLIFDTILSLNFNCDNEGAIILSAKGGLPNYQYSIDSGISFSSNKRFKVEEASTYQVQIKDNNGCIIKSSTKVRGPKHIEIEAYPKETITLPGEPITLGFNYTKGDSKNVQSILWKPSDGLSCTDCANPIATPYTPMQYSVTIFYNNLCSATEIINIRHTKQNSELFIPNSFSPESSNPENQTFKIYSNHLQKATLKIFNRWGEKVFESNNAQNIGWDGTYKGEPMKTAVYIYWAEVTYLDGRKVIKSGDLTLIR